MPHPFERIGGTDCTNFVSSAWHHGGGVGMRDNWYIAHDNSWWPDVIMNGHRSWAAPWAASYNFAVYWSIHDQYEASWWNDNLNNKFSIASSGDAYLYDWGRGEGWSHLAISTGFTSFGDKIAQHDTDRRGAVWNIGYLNESNPDVRDRMHVSVVHAIGGY